jgi:peptide deformylase
VATYEIRQYGDPVLRQRARDVDEIDGRLKTLADDMVVTMYDAPGVGLAAPQVGVQKRIFVFDTGDGPKAIVNPVISESRGEWTYDEGCLSIPGLSWPIVRPKEVHLAGYDLDGQEISIDADEFLARVFLHEVDHLDGVLLVERLDEDQRKEALRLLRARALNLPAGDPDGLSLLGNTAPEADGDEGEHTDHVGL